MSLGYITRQGKAQVVKLNHLPEDASPQAIYGYMKLHQKLREEEFQRRPLKNNMFRMEISPSKEESEGWTLEDWKRLAEDFVQVFDRVRLPVRPENRYGQMTYKERLAFATSDEGKDYLFPLGIFLDGKRYETTVSGIVVKAFYEERAAPFAGRDWQHLSDSLPSFVG